jgi:glutathione peroxidase
MTTAHDFTLKTIDGKERSLSHYKGRVLLVVNVASQCGLTPQYTALEALHRRLVGRGLAVLGVPCNQFGAQEPANDDAIKTFCSTKYDVTFDMFSKVDVNGDKAHPLYKWLTGDAKHGGDIKWNFGKFLIGKNGELLARFEPQTTPDDKQLVDAIEKALGSAAA